MQTIAFCDRQCLCYVSRRVTQDSVVSCPPLSTLPPSYLTSNIYAPAEQTNNGELFSNENE